MFISALLLPLQPAKLCFASPPHVSLIGRVAGHAGSCACEHDTTRRFDIGSKSNEERAGSGLRNVIAELQCYYAGEWGRRVIVAQGT